MPTLTRPAKWPTIIAEDETNNTYVDFVPLILKGPTDVNCR